MGGFASTARAKARHIIWCDTEGGVRNVKLWDITCIEETEGSLRGQRFVSVRDATKRGKARLRSVLPAAVYRCSGKTGHACTASYSCNGDGEWEPSAYTMADASLPDLLVTYLNSKAGSVLVAWNMRGHDKHVLTRAVGKPVLDQLTLWDGLPWFRSKYVLPKNTMSSALAGTPRSVFQVPDHGAAHCSFPDAAHMRDVIRRAAYCLAQDDRGLDAYKSATREEMFDSVCSQVQDDVCAADWCEVVDAPWAPGNIPGSVYKEGGM